MHEKYLIEQFYKNATFIKWELNDKEILSKMTMFCIFEALNPTNWYEVLYKKFEY